MIRRNRRSRKSIQNKRQTARLSQSAIVETTLEERVLLTPQIEFDFQAYSGSLDTSKEIFGQSGQSPFTIVYWGQGEITDLEGLPNLVAAVEGDVSRYTFSFGTFDLEDHIEVVSLNEFDDGLSDGLANQVFVPNGSLEVGGEKADDPSFYFELDGDVVATGRMEYLEIETNPQQVSTSPLIIVQMDDEAPAGADPAIFNELLAATPNASGEFRFSLNAFDWQGDIGFDDPAEFNSTGQSLFTSDQIDYGDAPDSYGTTMAENGASHGIDTNLVIGTFIDGEDDGAPGSMANLDDLRGIDDEDGATDIEVARSTSPTITVPVTNALNSTATLYGWIDYDGSGTFDAGESAMVSVPSGATEVDLTFPEVPSTAVSSTFARFRLSTDSAAASPTGAARDGEVEDYMVEISSAGTFEVRANNPTVDEVGAQSEFEVVLGSAPTDGDVVFLVTSDNEDEVIASPGSLTFDSTNWDTPQIVTLNGVDDELVDGDQQVSVEVAIVPEDSSDEFDNLPPETVSVLNEDDDEAGLILSNTSVRVSEDGTSADVTVELIAAPVTPVVLLVESDTPNEAEVALAELTISFDNWETPQTITITGVDDDDVDGDQFATVSVRVDTDDSDAAFADVPEELIDVTIVDNDVPNFTVSESALTVSEDGTSDQFEIFLNAAPESNVILNVASDDEGESLPSPTAFTFTPENWDIAQAVTITGVDDIDVDGDQTSEITVSVDAESDDAYTSVESQTVAVTTTDNDAAPGLVINKQRLTVSEEGQEDFFTVQLTSEPASPVVLEFNPADAAQVTLSSVCCITLSPSNWDQPQRITVAGAEDGTDDGTQFVDVGVSVVVEESDAAYANLGDETLTVKVTQETEFAIDADGDGQLQPLTDGILALRYLAGFTGDSLIGNALNEAGASRPSADEVSDWLASGLTALDVDGDGTNAALTDGILLLRYMAGFTGDALIANAIGDGATRTTGEEISDWLDRFTWENGMQSGSGGGSATMSSAGSSSAADIDRLFDEDDLFDFLG